MDGIDRLCRRLPASIAGALAMLGSEERRKLEEIRLYAGAQAELVISGTVKQLPVCADMDELLAALSAQALYSCERQLAMGYIPLPGGHRAGVCGRMTRQKDGTWIMADVSEVCIRISRRISGASLPIRPFLLDDTGCVQRVLILGAPGCGKTTMLRDAALWLAEKGVHVAVADEREELFGEKETHGRISVLSGMDKAQAFSLLLRSMAPQAIVSDEIGNEEDVRAIGEMVRCGVGLLVSAHARSMREAACRPALRQMLVQEAFDWYVLLGRHACVRAVYDRRGNQWEEDKHGQLGYRCDDDDCNQRSGLSDFRWREAARALDTRNAALFTAHEQRDPL